VAIADSAGRILACGRLPTEAWAGPLQAVQRVTLLLGDLCRTHMLDPRAIGVGLPGLIDTKTDEILLLPNLPADWRGFKMAKALESATKKPVSVMNDARLATLGEYTFVSHRRSSDMLFVSLGTGIGGGLVLDGKLRFGAFGAAGEIGHQTILPDGPQCGCGSRGCLETLFSGPVLAAAGRTLLEAGNAPHLDQIVCGDPCKVTAVLMAAAAGNGDREVGAIIRAAAGYLGIGIANAVTLYGVVNVVIGGGLAALGDLILKPIRQALRERVRMFPADSIQVSCSVLGDNCGALGGVALAMHKFNATTFA
jgi:glucokinase